MIKKIFLASCFMLNSYSFFDLENIIVPEINSVAHESIDYVVKMFGISSCDSKSHKTIKLASATRLIIDAYTIMNNLQEAYKRLQILKQSSLDEAKTALNFGFMLFSLWTLKNNVNYCLFDIKTFRNSKKIAKFNKAIQLDLRNEKIKQAIWLTINKLFVKASFTLKNVFNDNRTFRDSISTSIIDNSQNSKLFFIVVKLIADFSENQRNYSFYQTIRKTILKKIKQS